jgi:hypothetical protein
MPVTVKVNGVANSLVHKGSNGVSIATIPDVCKTPSPGGPVPIPYPNISQSVTLANGTTTVKADGGMMIAIKGSEFSLSNGDNAGVAGGVKSSTFMKESTWILYSFDVKMDGANACRLTDKKFQNHENTADLAGVLQQPVTALEEAMVEIAKKCHKKVEAENEERKAKKKKGKSCTSRGRKKHKCCEQELKKQQAAGRHKSAKAEYTDKKVAPDCRLDVAVVENGKVTKIYDYKFNCDGEPKMSAAQEQKYKDRFGEKVPITLIGVS